MRLRVRVFLADVDQGEFLAVEQKLADGGWC
jgi:hypothetical protein